MAEYQCHCHGPSRALWLVRCCRSLLCKGLTSKSPGTYMMMSYWTP